MSNELNYNIADQDTSKETQTLIIKLWELIRNTTEKINSFQERIIDLEQKNIYFDRQRNEDNVKIHDLEHQLDNLNHELELLGGNNNYYNDIITSLESELESTAVYKTELDNLRNRYEIMELKLDSIQKTATLVPELKNEIEQKNKALKEATLQVSDLQSQNKKLNIDLFNFIEIKKDLAAKNILLFERSNEILNLKDKVSLFDSKIFLMKNIENESESLKKHIIVLNNHIEEKQSIFNSEKIELIEKISLYQDIIKNLRIELGSYETQSITLQENIKSQHIIVKELTSDKIQLNEEIELLKNSVIDNERILLQNTEDISTLEAQISIHRNLLTDRNNEIENINNSLSNLSAQLTDSINKNESLKNIIETYQSKIANQESKIAQLNSELSEKEDEIHSIKIDMEEVNNALELKNVENYNLKFEVDRLSANLNELHSKCGIFESQITFLDSDILIKNHDINQLNNELKSLKVTLENSYHLLENSYQTEIEKLNLQIADLNSEKILLTQRLSKINSKVERDFITLNEKDGRIQILENELIEFKNTLEQFDSDFNKYAEKEEEYLSEVNYLKELISKLNDQIIYKESLSENYKKLDSEIAELNLENQNLLSELNSLKARNAILESSKIENSDWNLKITELTNEITIKEITIINLRQRVTNLEELLITRYEQISILENQINDFIADKQDKAIEKRVLSEKIDKYIVLIDEELNIKS
jgi:chromosome segregation ATPase